MVRVESVLLILIALFHCSCDKENPIQPANLAPVLSNLSVPDTIFTQTNQSQVVSVKCADENGLDDVDSVAYQIANASGQVLASGIMLDDGNYESHGDNIAGDGKYSQRLKLTIAEGSYRFRVQAVDRAGLRSNLLDKQFFARIGAMNRAPILLEYRLPDSVYVDEVVPFFIAARASDPDSLDYIARVVYEIWGPSISELAETGTLNDAGADGDSLAGDGIYSMATTTRFAMWKFGSYHLMVQAYDSRNKPSNSLYEILPWAKVRAGVAPQIISVSAPDTIQLPAAGSKSFLLTARVTDADDNRDIHEVYFDSYRPDGSASSGNPFKMYDDGTSGDATAGDFVYSLQIFITSQNSPGNYRFEFQAKDYSELLSNKIIHIITVIR
ncbi:MAG: hypothetical protein ONB11_04830 [candidate division KSB1 bacterium]|nr:hypothetical protein [candidate division KSB1 bacterium]MDZ7340078.1 hypothetical protein [candidate division KSB1 bacterium]